MKRSKEQELSNKLKEIKSISQLKNIFKNSLSANQSLYGDIQMLKQKLKLCEEKCKVTPPSEQLTKSIDECKREIELQYKIMHNLKRQIDKQHSTSRASSLKQQRQRIQNDLSQTQSQLTQQKKNRNDLIRESRRLEQTIKAFDSLGENNIPSLQQLASDNLSLRKKITAINFQVKQNDLSSAKAVDQMYKHKETLHQRNLSQSAKELNRYSSLEGQSKNNSKGKGIKSMTLDKQQVNNKLIQEKKLQEQVNFLKKQCQRISNQHLKQENNYKNRISQLFLQNKQVLHNLNKLQKSKLKFHSQLNKYQKILSAISKSPPINHPKQYIQSSSQTSFLKPNPQSKPLRRDFAGVLGGRFSFDERQTLDDRNILKIIGFTVYQYEYTTGRTILSAIQSHPNIQVDNNVDLPASFLSKCNKRKHMFMEDDFLKLIKVKCSSVENRITKIQFKSNRGLKFEYGDKRDMGQVLHGESIYTFDIQPQEHPVCFFGTFAFYRQYWQLEAFGCQILTESFDL